MPDDTHFLCPECSMLADRIRRVTQFDGYENRALDGAVEAAGAYMDRLGKTDLCEFDAGEAATLCRVIVRGFGDRLRHLIASEEAPF
ncbi:DUF6511 domain-containing protein [Kaustia mangrovi]|uniref:DUF6511 domain-containing protein n=1 Tax=Kaustia mangrovi TaxID=2593653 RepID=UPI001BD06B44|nr:DUF6511 domain-containing protein [Kaustia mangrovi]